MPDFNLPGLLHTLDAFSQFEVDTIIFAHNGNYLDPLETGDQDTVRFQIQYITDIQEAVRAEMDKGTPFFLLPDKVKLPQYSGLAQYDSMFPLNVMRVAASETLGPLSWRKEEIGDTDTVEKSLVPASSSWWPINFPFFDF